jgi:hypothetical protein
MGGESLGEPVASDLLRRAVVVWPSSPCSSKHRK